MWLYMVLVILDALVDRQLKIRILPFPLVIGSSAQNSGSLILHFRHNTLQALFKTH